MTSAKGGTATSAPTPRISPSRTTAIYTRLDGGAANRPHDGRDPLRRVPGGMRVHRLKIIGPEHHDDQRQRRVDLDSLLDARQSVAAALERVIPGRPPSVEAILNDPDFVAGGDQGQLHHPRPAGLERQSATRARDDAPGQRVGIDEDLLHPLPSRIGERGDVRVPPQATITGRHAKSSGRRPGGGDQPRCPGVLSGDTECRTSNNIDQ